MIEMRSFTGRNQADDPPNVQVAGEEIEADQKAKEEYMKSSLMTQPPSPI